MPLIKKHIYLLALMLALCTVVHAQEKPTIHIMGQLGYSRSSGEKTPYWLTARRQGIMPNEPDNGYLRLAGVFSGRIGNGNFRYCIGADIFANYNHNSNFFVHQAYADISWRWLTLSIGSKERFSEGACRQNLLPGNKAIAALPGLYAPQLSDLGSGGLVYSGNSRPIPQIRLEVPEYATIPGTNGWLHMRGHFAYGRFSDGNFQERFSKSNGTTRYGKNIFYHSKAAFMKIGKPQRFPLTLEGGLEMYSQFGGDIYTHSGGRIVSMPHRLTDFLKAFIPLSGGEDTPLDEQTNISGNQIGNWHAALTLHTNPADICLYGEHMFEDFSQLFFFEYQSNKEGKKRIIYYPWRDMKIGIRVTNKSSFASFINAIQYEYISTYDQSGALYHDPSKNFNEQMDGVDNYYNHGIYPGWHHWGMGIGSPLVISPTYNKDGSLAFRSNRLIAHNIGLNGKISKQIPIAYRLQYTYSENWGTYLNPLPEKGYTTSLLGEFVIAPDNKNWAGALSIAYDNSNYIGNSFGAMISVTRLFTTASRKKK